MPHISNRDRIARAAEEARLKAAEKATKKTATKSTGTSVKREPKAPARMKLVWHVCTPGGKVVKTFAYPEKAAAEAEIQRLAKNSGTHILTSSKVPMD